MKPWNQHIWLTAGARVSPFAGVRRQTVEKIKLKANRIYASWLHCILTLTAFDLGLDAMRVQSRVASHVKSEIANVFFLCPGCIAVLHEGSSLNVLDSFEVWLGI